MPSRGDLVGVTAGDAMSERQPRAIPSPNSAPRRLPFWNTGMTGDERRGARTAVWMDGCPGLMEATGGAQIGWSGAAGSGRDVHVHRAAPILRPGHVPPTWAPMICTNEHPAGQPL